MAMTEGRRPMAKNGQVIADGDWRGNLVCTVADGEEDEALEELGEGGEWTLGDLDGVFP